MAFRMSMPSSDSAGLPSSPYTTAIFSDSPTRRSPTPPSSPPQQPLESDLALQPKSSSRPQLQNAFTILGKRKALSDIPNNVVATSSKKAKTGIPFIDYTYELGGATTNRVEEIFSAAIASKKATANRSSRNATTKPALTQMQLSLGQKTQRCCPDCWMTYVHTSAEDRKIHKQYCKENRTSEGIRAGGDFLDSLDRTITTIPAGAHQTISGTAAAVAASEARGNIFRGIKPRDSICVLNRASKAKHRHRVLEVLKHVQQDLGAVEISAEELWGYPREPKGKALKARDKRVKGEDVKAGLGGKSKVGGRYRALLYIRAERVIGFLLVERIREARSVVRPSPSASDATTLGDGASMGASASTSTVGVKGGSALEALRARRAADDQALKDPFWLSKDSVPAALGVSRIWTAPAARGQAVAGALLDAAFGKLRDWWACSDADAGVTGDELAGRTDGGKGLVAFSQPTEAGTRLARKWFGRDWGWSVYTD